MDLHKYEIITPQTSPPKKGDWQQMWHGYHQMKKVCSEDKRIHDKQQHLPDSNYHHKLMKESALEQNAFLSIIADIQKSHINMMELGAGRGDWCLSLAGIIDNKLIKCKATTYSCLALEAEPTHFKWTCEHFEAQNINASAVHGAIQAYDGPCRLLANFRAADHYGQSINPYGNIPVNGYTIDTLMTTYNLPHVDIIHMDVQGAEVDAIIGAQRAIKNGAIDYFLIGTHGQDMNTRLGKILCSNYEVVININPGTKYAETSIGPAALPVDGMMLFRRKESLALNSPTLKEGKSHIRRHLLQNRIVDESPGLSSALGKNNWFDVACLLREWCFQHANLASIKTQMAYGMPQIEKFALEDVDTTAYLYDQLKTGSVCGGTAFFLSQVYHLFGLDTSIYDFGIPSLSLTHVVTVVKINQTNIYSLQDAYLNGYFTYDNSPADFQQLEMYTEIAKWGFSKGEKTTKKTLSLPDGLDVPKENNGRLLDPIISERKFSWDEGQEWFGKKVEEHKISIASFYELLYYPLFYNPISIENEKLLFEYLKKNSTKHGTYYTDRMNKSSIYLNFDSSISNKKIENCLSSQINMLQLKSSDIIVLYGATNYGNDIRTILTSRFDYQIAIVDGDNRLHGHQCRGITVQAVKDLTILKPAVIIICSIEHEDVMVENAISIYGSRAQLITIKSLMEENS